MASFKMLQQLLSLIHLAIINIKIVNSIFFFWQNHVRINVPHYRYKNCVRTNQRVLDLSWSLLKMYIIPKSRRYWHANQYNTTKNYRINLGIFSQKLWTHNLTTGSPIDRGLNLRLALKMFWYRLFQSWRFEIPRIRLL